MVRLTGVERRCTSVVTRRPGLEQINLWTPRGTDHPLCNFSMPVPEKDMADVMEVLLLITGGGGNCAEEEEDVDVVVIVFLGTVMDDMGLVVRGDISEEASC